MLSKGRQITVAGRKFQWRLPSKHRPRFYGDPWTGGVITVLSVSCGSCLQIGLQATKPGDPDGNFESPKAVLTPAIIAGYIQAALAAGWNPDPPNRRPFRLGPGQAPGNPDWRVV